MSNPECSTGDTRKHDETSISLWLQNAEPNDQRGAYLERRTSLMPTVRYLAAYRRHARYPEGSFGAKKWQVVVAYMNHLRDNNFLEVGDHAFNIMLDVLHPQNEQAPVDESPNAFHQVDPQDVLIYTAACKTTWKILGYTHRATGPDQAPGKLTAPRSH